MKVAAVAGVHHPKWEERPILLVEPHAGSNMTGEDMTAWLEPRIVKWWMPDRIIIDTVPLTATGKIDKKAIRDRYGRVLAEPAA